MKRLILSGALLLSVATSCNDVRADWLQDGDYTSFTFTPQGSFPGSSWTTGGYMAHGIYTKAIQSAQRGFDPIAVDENKTRAGSKWFKEFKWRSLGINDRRPGSITISHKFSLDGNLKVSCPGPADANTMPYATAKVTFYGGPGTLLDDGRNELTARPGAVVPNRRITNSLGPFTQGDIVAPGVITTHRVEVRIESYAKANGVNIPAGVAAARAGSGEDLGGSKIWSTEFTVR